MKKIILLLSFLLLTSCGGKKELSCLNGELESGVCKEVLVGEVVSECREGYKYNEETKLCENDIELPMKKVSKCPEGYFLGSDNWCLSNEEVPEVLKVTCDESELPNDDSFASVYVTEDNICLLKTCKKLSEDKKSCLEFDIKEVKNKKAMVCPKGTKRDKNVCRYKHWMDKTYSCEKGVKKDNKCLIHDAIPKDKMCKDKEYKYDKEKDQCILEKFYEPVYK